MRLKKHIATLSVILFFISPMLTTGYYMLKKQQLFASHAQRLRHKSLLSFAIPASTIVWVKKDKELYIQNRLIDVKAIHYRNGTAFLLGYDDSEEQHFIGRFSNHTGKTIPAIFFAYFFFHPNPGWQHNVIAFSAGEQQYSFPPFILCTRTTETESPPPNILG